MAQRHLIRKHRVVLKMQEKSAMFRTREILHRELNEKVWPALDQLLSALCPDGEVIRIEQLNINLGKMNKRTFEQTFAEKLLNQLNLQLRELTDDNRVPGSNGASLRPVSENEADAFLFYLQNGYFPWWFGKERMEAAFRDLLKLPEENRLFSRFLQIFVYREARVRYVSMTSGRTDEIILSLADTTVPAIRQLIADLMLFRMHLKVRLGIADLDFYERLLLAIAVAGGKGEGSGEATGPKESMQAFLCFFIRELARLCGKDLSAVARMMQGSLMLEEPGLRLKVLNRDFWNDAFGRMPAVTFPAPQRPDKKQENSYGHETKDNGWMVGNAGVVLLHPFIPHLFKGLGLLGEDDQFISDEAARQAAVLLQHVVKGPGVIYEHDLVLNKLLCGLAPENLILPADYPLTGEQSDEIEKMLKTVVDYWAALMNTSVMGLRETFLIREGKVELREGEILVRPERKTVDVLIERLPWGLSVIKLPWLKTTLHVEW